MNLRTLTLDELARRWLSTGEADVANEIAKRVLEGEYIDSDTHTPVNDLLIENQNVEVEAIRAVTEKASDLATELQSLFDHQRKLIESISILRNTDYD
jgi:hypothetical protein